MKKSLNEVEAELVEAVMDFYANATLHEYSSMPELKRLSAAVIAMKFANPAQWSLSYDEDDNYSAIYRNGIKIGRVLRRHGQVIISSVNNADPRHR